MYYKTVILILLSGIIIILLGCKKKYIADKIYYSQSEYEYNIDTVLIKIDSITLPNYFTYCSFLYNNQNYYMGFNRHYYTLDIFNLSSHNYVKSINLDNQGPNGIAEITSLFWINSDSILLSSDSWFYIINDRGNIIDKVRLVTDNPEVQLINNVYFRLIYNSKRKSVYFFNIYPKKRMYTESYVITEYNLYSKTFSEIPISFSEYYIDNRGNLGYLSWMNLYNIIDNNIIYNFQYESNIYRFNIDTREIEVFNAISKKYSNLSRPIKSDATEDLWSKHALESAHYLTVLNDNFNDLVYRFNWGEVSHKRADGFYNSFIDKPLSLTLLDSEYNWIKEIELPDGVININSWFVNSDGLWVSPTHPKNGIIVDDYLIFYLYKFNPS